MSDFNVAERLKLFIEKRGLSYSQFADSCGIPRPSLSQLITGRNKKINDTMIRSIHSEYPDLSISWLLFGEGEMEISPKNSNDSYDSEGEENNYSPYSDSLFDFEERQDENHSKNIVFSGREPSSVKNPKETGLKIKDERAKEIDLNIDKLKLRIKELTSQIEILKKNPRKVDQITVYYDDSTFETFIPASR